MATRSRSKTVQKLDEMIHRLGDVPLDRIVCTPSLGKATEADLLRLQQMTERLYELVDGVLVEKPIGYLESSLAVWIAHLLAMSIDVFELGNLAGADGTVRLMPGLVRVPDVSFTRWEKFPGGTLPTTPIPDLVPDLAIEVLSPSNTAGEMRRKLKDYFLTGTVLVWLVDPVRRTVTVHTAPDEAKELGEADTLEGGTLLPGLKLPVRRLFERLPAPTPPSTRRRRKKA